MVIEMARRWRGDGETAAAAGHIHMSTGSRQEQRCRDRAETREMHDGSKDIRQAMGRVPHA